MAPGCKIFALRIDGSLSLASPVLQNLPLHTDLDVRIGEAVVLKHPAR